MKIHRSRGVITIAGLAILATLGGCASWSGKAPNAATLPVAAATSATAPVAATAAGSVATAEPAPPEATDNSPVVTFMPAIQPPIPPESLWVRLRRGFSLPDGNEHRVQIQLNWYRLHPGYMMRTATRAQPYLYYIVQQLKKRNMPLDLALLPVVESAFDPFAYSNGRASGLWQFIPSTGRLYGLHENWWYDGRRDIVSSTNAALSCLQALHKQFGSWLLALAAYNSGSGTVEYAIRYNRRHHRPTDFWHLNLPVQTRNYVPRLLAVRDIVENADKYDIALPPVPNAPYLAQVKLHGQIDLAVAANMIGISLKQMYLLNPGYNRWATPPDNSVTLLMPLDDKDAFMGKLESMKKKIEVQWVGHRIRPGESLGVIANRYHTTIAQLKRRNGLHNNLIRAGHVLMVPSPSKHYTRYVLSEPMRVARTQNRAHGAHKNVIHVQNGDTFWGLARLYHVSVAKLAKWNGMAPHDTLHVGQKLVVWQSGHSRPLGARRSRSSYPVSALRRIRYVVHRGDSLSSISDHFNVSLHKLARWNELSMSSILHPGQRLTLFVDVRNQF